ncbi:hypothetical protein LRC484719_26170 [Mycobacterium riyadhense]
MIGKARNVGLRVGAAPDNEAAATTPNVATEMATGSSLINRPGDAVRGTSGGAATSMSAVTVGRR